MVQIEASCKSLAVPEIHRIFESKPSIRVSL